MTDDPIADALRPETLFGGSTAPLPDPEFAAALRRRIAAHITPTPEETAVPTDRPRFRPPGSATIVPYLAVHDARAAIDWYVEVFSATVTYEPIVMDDGRIGHVELTIDGATFQMADEFPDIDVLGPLARGGPSVSLTLYVPDVDATYALAVERGATGERAPADQFHGSRSASIRDPFGHRWIVQTYQGADAVGAEPAGPTQAQDLWNEVGYYVIEVPELAPALRFYGELFAWRFEPTRPASTGVGEYAHVESGRVPFGLHGGGEAATTWQPYFRVRDLDAAVARVRELGGTVESVERHPSGGNASCRDDQGVSFELWEPADGY